MMEPEEMEGTISVVETSEQESFNRGEKSQKSGLPDSAHRKTESCKQLANEFKALTQFHPGRIPQPGEHRLWRTCGGVEQGQADGHIAVIGHGSQQEALSCPKHDDKTELGFTTSNKEGQFGV